jgi:hypothetical protein
MAVVETRTRESATEALINALADAIDPDILGAQIGQAIVERVAEFAQRADDDLLHNTQRVATRTPRDVWHGVRMRRPGGRQGPQCQGRPCRRQRAQGCAFDGRGRGWPP